MPRLKDATITKAWRQSGESGRIHYIVTRATGDPRRLYADDGTPLYEVLEQHLASLGYAGPKSAEEH